MLPVSPIQAKEEPPIYDFQAFCREHIKSVPPMTRDEERALFQKVKQGDRTARDEFLHRNYRLVLWAISKWFTHSPMPDEDLFAAGVEGLMRAMQTFDPDLGRFSTYASRWVRQRISRIEDNEGRLVRMPVNEVKLLKKIHHLTGGSYDGVDAEELARATKATKLQVALALQGRRVNSFVWLDESHGPEGNLLIDPPDPGAEEALDSVNDAESQLEEALSLLPPLARELIELRFSLNGNDGQRMTLDELAEKYGTSRKKIKRVERKSLKFLRERAPHLRELLGA